MDVCASNLRPRRESRLRQKVPSAGLKNMMHKSTKGFTDLQTGVKISCGKGKLDCRMRIVSAAHCSEAELMDARSSPMGSKTTRSGLALRTAGTLRMAFDSAGTWRMKKELLP